MLTLKIESGSPQSLPVFLLRTMTFQNNPVLTEQLPQVADSPLEKPHQKLLQVSLIGNAIFLTVLLVGPILVTFLVPVLWIKLLVWGGWLLLAGLSLLATIMGFRRKAFSLRERDLTYHSGWLFHAVISVPFTRVQHCEVSQGPIERALGLASLKVFTAGGSSSDLSIPGLLPERARTMNQFILQRISKDHDSSGES